VRGALERGARLPGVSGRGLHAAVVQVRPREPGGLRRGELLRALERRFGGGHVAGRGLRATETDEPLIRRIELREALVDRDDALLLVQLGERVRVAVERVGI